MRQAIASLSYYFTVPRVSNRVSNNSVGYDGGKKVKVRKRHLLVDTMGLVLMVMAIALSFV